MIEMGEAAGLLDSLAYYGGRDFREGQLADCRQPLHDLITLSAGGRIGGRSACLDFVCRHVPHDVSGYDLFAFCQARVVRQRIKRLEKSTNPGCRLMHSAPW